MSKGAGMERATRYWVALVAGEHAVHSELETDVPRRIRLSFNGVPVRWRSIGGAPEDELRGEP
jgi:hypothetical protein